MRLKILFTAAFLCSIIISSAQTKTVKNVVGKYEISRDISLAMAQKKAYEEAKQEALRKAGISENIWSVFGMITQEDGESFSEIYSEMSVLAINGIIRVKEGPTYGKEVNPIDGKEYATATIIEAEVNTDTKVDKTYKMNVEGLSSVYKEGELMTFDITTYGADSYIKIFWFDTENGSIIYPYMNYDPEKFVFKNGEKYSFPRNSIMEYAITKNNPKNESEKINIMVVATKKYYPFLSDEVSFESLLSWIYDIPSSDRCAFYQMAVVK